MNWVKLLCEWQDGSPMTHLTLPVAHISTPNMLWIRQQQWMDGLQNGQVFISGCIDILVGEFREGHKLRFHYAGFMVGHSETSRSNPESRVQASLGCIPLHPYCKESRMILAIHCIPNCREIFNHLNFPYLVYIYINCIMGVHIFNRS